MIFNSLEEIQGPIKMARGKNEQSGSVDMQNNLTHVKDMSNDKYQYGLRSPQKNVNIIQKFHFESREQIPIIKPHFIKDST